MNKLTAAQAIRKLAHQYESMVEAAAALEALGSMEQTETEAKGRIADLRAEEARLTGIVAAAKQSVKDAESAAATSISEAKQSAASVRKAAEDAAKRAADEAGERAKLFFATAQKEADQKIDEAKAGLAKLEDRRLAADKAAAQAEAMLADKNAELASITDKIAQAKSGLRAFVGA